MSAEHVTRIESHAYIYTARCSCGWSEGSFLHRWMAVSATDQHLAEVVANACSIANAKEAPMPDRVLTALQVAEIRNALCVIAGNAGLIQADERAHPLLVSKAKVIMKSVMQITDLLPAEKADTHAG